MTQKPHDYPFPNKIDREHLHTEQPLDPLINRNLQRPNPLDPIGHIETEGRALRNLASGRMPLWVLLLGWSTIGLISFGILGLSLHQLTEALQMAIVQQQMDEVIFRLLSLIPMAVMSGLFLMILWRATWRRR
ncbi:hypothetical protein IQ266_21180 [filamentous cyanobacterium LEGE 11480]|uniref:Uncharacterized protein n=1 Tax=Romeriopsis navalis LEGE 11480 TaxID=2777977 RepID=A0A928VTH2_9CYAN|nr:hypothetical protein [Romeriopsis navalis]MBE9032257.1 hypothetical protein [Romeriopsis navalis LEGE 11480]